MAVHTFCPRTDFCTDCGISMQLAMDADAYECARAGNVIAVSHIICERSFKELCQAPKTEEGGQ